MKNTQIYKYTIPANGSVQILTEGSYFRILSASGPVEVDADTYGNIIVLAGQGVKDQPFKRLFLVDKSGSTNNVELLVSDGSFIDDRITGEVSVIDGGVSRTLANQAFLGFVQCPPLAANYSHTQLFNPAGSGLNVIISKIIASSEVANTVRLERFLTPLTSLFGQGKTKKMEALETSSIAQLRYQNNVSILSDGTRMNFSVQASASMYLKFDEPIVLSPGSGLNVTATGVLNCYMFSNFEWLEKPIL